MLLTHEYLKDLSEKELLEVRGYVRRHPNTYPKDTDNRLESLRKQPGEPIKIMDRDAAIRVLNAINTGVYGEDLRKKYEADEAAKEKESKQEPASDH